MPGVTGTLGRPTAISTQPKRGRGPHHHVEAAVDWFFSNWRHTVSSKFFDTQVPSTFNKELVLLRHARCVLSRFCCTGHSLLLGSYLSRIGRRILPAAPFHLVLHCHSYGLFGDSLSLYDLWSRPWGFARLLRLHGLTAIHPSLGRGRVITTTT